MPFQFSKENLITRQKRETTYKDQTCCLPKLSPIIMDQINSNTSFSSKFYFLYHSFDMHKVSKMNFMYKKSQSQHRQTQNKQKRLLTHCRKCICYIIVWHVNKTKKKNEGNYLMIHVCELTNFIQSYVYLPVFPVLFLFFFIHIKCKVHW